MSHTRMLGPRTISRLIMTPVVIPNWRFQPTRVAEYDIGLIIAPMACMAPVVPLLGGM